MKTAEVECEWAIAPGERGQPALVSLVPGGALMFEHRNLAKKGRTLTASISTQNFLSPSDDLGFRVRASSRRPCLPRPHCCLLGPCGAVPRGLPCPSVSGALCYSG